ncbi:MAG TPA: hypothetical protein DIT15_01415 [Arthrobacter bacterium]|jgi:hypothetical protein|nr:hypothetical protein [Arthrobacter sp.]HAP89183.1 hypothetical protein [Arthrobacter sp.]HBH59257.1 hypothetical protein [Arthrobacter sp.]HCB57357.1 hypothetical protein [Arthrobacter sp.]HCC39464.1 hypothetical protein [Arthrobacter sp.]
MTHKATSWGLRTAALLLAGALATGCSAPGGSGSAWTAQPDTSASPGAAADSTGTTGSPSSNPSAPDASASVSPGPAATSAAWKTFTDPAKTVSFDLPEEWIAQSVAPEDGAMPGALKIEVKKQDGTFVAALRTGLPPSSPSACPDGAGKPYVVISSVPVELPGLTGEGTIAPHAVFRVIQGYHYFGSYGITNIVGGADRQACELLNVVRGPAGKGDYSFGDLGALKAFAPDEKVAPAKAFDTLGQAAKYVEESPEFANVQRMLMSLKIKN